MLWVSPHTPNQSPTPITLNMTLYLNIFQGEPAISEFDRHITPNHSSSEDLAASSGAVLLQAFAWTQPDHG